MDRSISMEERCNMNGVQLSGKVKESQQSISKKTTKAMDNGIDYIKIKGDRYKFTYISGRYEYTKIEEEIKTKSSEAPPKYLSFSKEKRKEAELRYELVQEYENRGNISYSQFVAKLPLKYHSLSFTQRQFLRWVQIVRECPKERSPLIDLIDKRGIQAKPKAIDGYVEELIKKMILEKPHRKVRRIYEYLEKENIDIPSYETVRKWVADWKKKEYLIYAFATNPDKAKGMYKPAGGSMSESVSFCNQIWELDATPADVICSDGKRYVLSAAIDVYSRRVVVVVEESAIYTTLAKVMRKGIKKFGVPANVRIDNGKDYTSNYFTYTCQRLRINQILCPPYSGEYKPHIERFFRTLSHELFEEMDGYIGHSVSDREALQSQKSFSAKLQSIKEWRERYKNGDEFAGRFAIKKENAGLDVGIPLSKDELQSWIDKWILMYEKRRHGGIKTSPLHKWQSDSMPIKKINDERMLDILLGLSTMRTIRKKGVDWHGITYWSEMFGDMVGQKVWILSDDDMASVYIYDLDMNYLFTAHNPEYHNVSRSSFLAANKKWTAKLHKTIRAIEELRNEAPDRMKERIEQQTSDEVPIIKNEQSLEVISGAIDVIEDAKEKISADADVRINGRPAFSKKFDRFLWDIENDAVDETTKTLAKKYPDIWKMAQSEYERRQAG